MSTIPHQKCCKCMLYKQPEEFRCKTGQTCKSCYNKQHYEAQKKEEKY